MEKEGGKVGLARLVVRPTCLGHQPSYPLARWQVGPLALRIIMKTVRSKSKTNLVWTVTTAKIVVPGKSLLSSLILVNLII